MGPSRLSDFSFFLSFFLLWNQLRSVHASLPRNGRAMNEDKDGRGKAGAQADSSRLLKSQS